jgi:hypothetical protein
MLSELAKPGVEVNFSSILWFCVNITLFRCTSVWILACTASNDILFYFVFIPASERCNDVFCNDVFVFVC